MTSERGPIPAESYQEKLSRLRSFVDWLRWKGVAATASRFDRYVKVLENAAAWCARQDPLTEQELTEVVFVTREVDELLWIFQGLQVALPKGVDRSLKVLTSGNTLGRDDADEVSARDYQYELRVASYFLQAGYECDMSTEADLIVTIPAGRVFVECKRLKSERQVRRRAKEASRQLTRRLRPLSFRAGYYGLALFDITKIVHPGLGMTWSKDALDASDGLRAELSRFDATYDFTRTIPWHSRVLSISLQILCPNFNLGPQPIGTHFSGLHCTMLPSGGPRVEAFAQIRKAFDAHRIRKDEWPAPHQPLPGELLVPLRSSVVMPSDLK